MENMLITSGYDFEGYIITDYLGLCSGEAALGTGFLSSFGANLADLLGTNSSLYEEKLTDARDIALQNLISHAQSFGADGIIAVQIEYAVFSSDIMGVIANGTAVKLHKKNFTDVSVEIKETMFDCPLTPCKFLLSSFDSECYAQLVTSDASDNNVSVIKGNIVFTTVLEEEYKVNDIIFYDFSTENSNSSFYDLHPQTLVNKRSALTPLSIPINIIPLLKCASFKITKYIGVTKISNNLHEDNISTVSQNSTPKPERIDNSVLDEYLSYIKCLGSASEIYNYTIDFNSTHSGFMPEKLLSYIKSLASNERIYGNMAKDCLHEILSYYQK